MSSSIKGVYDENDENCESQTSGTQKKQNEEWEKTFLKNYIYNFEDLGELWDLDQLKDKHGIWRRCECRSSLFINVPLSVFTLKPSVPN